MDTTTTTTILGNKIFVNRKSYKINYRLKNGQYFGSIRIKNTEKLSGLSVYTTGQKLNFEEISPGIYRLKTNDFVANAIVAKNLITVSIRLAGGLL